MDESKVDGVDPLSVTKRLQRDGRWAEVEPVRDRLMKECKNNGMSKPDAQAWTYSELNRLYPPVTAEWTDDSESVDCGFVSGLSDIPASWGQLPPNSTLQAEIAWCQANRLSVVRETRDGAIVDLSKAKEPAPSWAALGWLETSIRAYAKFVDVAAKASANQEDEREMVKREKIAIEEIRALLAEMQDETT
ncbi:MAG: hypothetical protein ACKO9Q_10640 [Pirellula sp.]